MSSVIVVEGIHDQTKIVEVYPEANVVITNGSEISKATLDLLKELSKNNEIIIFTDPDSPGEKIRNTIAEFIPNVKHAFLRKKDAISKNKKKVGIEHTSKECIIESLSCLYMDDGKPDTIGIQDMYALGLIGMPNSAMRREAISDLLNIGKPNAKTFLKRINMLQIKKEVLEKICRKLEM